MSFFAQSLDLLKSYCETHGPLGSIATEARKRLRQIDLIIALVKQRESEYQDVMTSRFFFGQQHLHDQGTEGLRDEIEMLTEAFYWFAFRLRNVIRSLPGLEGFEAVAFAMLGTSSLNILRSFRTHFPLGLREAPESKDLG